MSDITLRPSLGLDAHDLQILATLQRDGRMTKVKLAEIIGLSPTPCGSRVERLEAAGLIRGYHADLELIQLTGLNRYRLTLTILNWTLQKAQRFETALARLPNVVECEAVLGDVDYILTVLASSVEHYQRLLNELLATLPGEVNFTSYPVSKSIKREASMSLLKLQSELA